MLLIVLGAIACLYGFVVILINAFRESVLWGLGSLFVGPVLLVYVVLNWSDNMKPFLIYLGGLAMVIVGAMMAAPDPSQMAVPQVEQ
jgi:hypothetical protein